MSPRSASRSVVRSALALFACAPALVGLAAGLAGCPIYAADTCESDPNCSPPLADADVAPDAPDAPAAETDGCGAGCDPGYVCTSVGTGAFQCVAYDCRAKEKACLGGSCTKNDAKGVWECASSGPPDCTKTGCIAGYACGDLAGKKVCVSSNANACVADADCAGKTGAGSLCLGGVCTPPKDVCNDASQCKGAASCVDGRCIPKCSATCATGYSCDAAKGVCTGGADACSATKACPSGKACVAGRCVDPAATDGSCAAGLVSVAGGCVVDDRANFFCDKDGTKDGKQDTCAAGSLCLHHQCYIACKDASDTTTCKTADKFPVCKLASSSSGSYFVCSAATSFGTACDPSSTPPKTCDTGKVCIDGSCL